MRILMYGSTALSEAVCHLLIGNGYDVIGYVPSVAAVFPARRMPVPPVNENNQIIQHDLKLSIQHDRKIVHNGIGYNLHTGILPRWAGCDILHHTLAEGADRQGLTFHQLTDEYDVGPIVSWLTYPVLPFDTVVDLYTRMLALAPGFVLSCLRMIEICGHEGIRAFSIFHEPKTYRRGRVDDDARKKYIEDRKAIEEYLKNRNVVEENARQ